VRLRTDERGVTVQIGTVLLFAVLIVLLSTYQASVVPQQNEQVEFNHNQQVQSQLQDLRDGLLRTAATGSGGSASVALGTQYPVRALFVNPASPSGTLQTTPVAEVRLENAEAAGETGDYWNGDSRVFETRGLTYAPLYHVYQNPPATVYRNGVLYNRFDDANRIVAGQRLVRGNTISMVALTGRLSESSSTSASVDFRPVSSATRTVTVENEDGEAVTLVVPTELSASTWEALLESELDPEQNDPEKHVTAVENVGGADAVRIVLEPGVYELEMAKVGVGSDVTEVGPHYVTDVRGDDESVAEGTSQKLVMEVRDRYNNPVTGAKVNLSINSTDPNDPDDALVHQGESKRSFEDLRTDSEGQVTVRFEAGEFNGNTREEQVNMSIEDAPNADFDGEAKENLTFDLQVYSVGGPGNGDGGDDGSGDSPTIETFDVTDQSTPCDRNPGGQCRGQSNTATFDITWDVTDDDLRSVTVYVNKSGTTQTTYSGASGTETYEESGAYGDDYTITLVARDGGGNRICERIADTANGDDSDQSRSFC
jgi:hypothetical protein